MNIYDLYELKEKVHHGTKDFPIEVYYATGLISSYHWHDECEFIYIESGNAIIRIGVESFELKKGECAFVKADTLHSISTKNQDNFCFYAVVFHPSLIFTDFDICSKYLSPKYIINSHFSSNPVEGKVIKMIKLLCNSYMNKSFAYELKIKSYLYSIFSHIFEHNLYHKESLSGNQKTVEKLEKVIKYIHANCHTYITVEELANVSGYSISHFSRFFKDLTGKTPIEYINRQRVYSACDKLKHTELSVLEVGLECGFENVGYFIKTFKKYTDFTPYQYKQKHSVNSV